MAYIRNHSGAKIMVADAALLPTAAAAAKDVEAVTELVVAEDTELAPADPDLIDDPRLVSYSEFLARGTGEPLSWSVSDELAQSRSTTPPAPPGALRARSTPTAART